MDPVHWTSTVSVNQPPKRKVLQRCTIALFKHKKQIACSISRTTERTGPPRKLLQDRRFLSRSPQINAVETVRYRDWNNSGSTVVCVCRFKKTSHSPLYTTSQRFFGRLGTGMRQFQFTLNLNFSLPCWFRVIPGCARTRVSRSWSRLDYVNVFGKTRNPNVFLAVIVHSRPCVAQPAAVFPQARRGNARTK